MNILLIGPLPPLRGGISDFNRGLLKNLSKIHKVEAISFTYLYPKFIFPGKSQFGSEIMNDFEIKVINPYNPLSYLATLNQIRKSKPDKIISTHWNPIFSISYCLINFFSSNKIEKIGMMHNVKSHENSFFDNLFLKFYLKSIDKSVCLSAHTNKEINSFYKTNSISLFHPIPPVSYTHLRAHET